MFKNFRDKIALSGITVLMIGESLLIFTFVSAYGFLTQSLSIIPTADFTSMFGEALAPIIVTCIRIMYLGVMGWVSSLITIRGVTIIAHAPAIPTPVSLQQPAAEPKPQPQSQPQPQKPKLVEKPKAEKPKEEKPKEVVKPPEPEIIVIPPEEIAQPQPSQPEQPKQPQQPQNNGAPQQSSNS
jgi:hypothetical protein